MKKEIVDAVELGAIDLGASGQFKHAVEADRRLLAFIGPFDSIESLGIRGIIA